MPSTQTRRAPLEWLVITQLESIEKLALKTRLASATASEISLLQNRMDRLNRMIDAMSPAWATTQD